MIESRKVELADQLLNVVMSTILFSWELGGGLGHLMQMRPIARGLLSRGHRVAAALKDLSRARQVFGADVPLMQAPLKNRFTDSVIRAGSTENRWPRASGPHLAEGAVLQKAVFWRRR